MIDTAGKLKIAIVHDYLREYGGAEKVAEAIQQLYPAAPFYTTYYLHTMMPEPDPFQALNITKSMPNLPGINKFLLSRAYVYLFPLTLSKFDFSHFDCVISSTAGVAKWINVRPPTVHICYCHSIPRFLYYSDSNVSRSSQLLRFANSRLNPLNSLLRRIDQSSAGRVDYFVANSQFTASKIAQVYRRRATVIYPPVDVHEIAAQAAELPVNNTRDYFLALGARHAFKQIDQIVEACRQAGAKLKIVGSPGLADGFSPKSRTGNVDVFDFLPRKELVLLLFNCRALILAGKEDFGIAAVEALSAGRPVIAQKYSGTAEIVQLDEKYGKLFDPQRGPSLKEVVATFRTEDFNPDECQQRAYQFDQSLFRNRFAGFVDTKLLESYQQRKHTISLFSSIKQMRLEPQYPQEK